MLGHLSDQEQLAAVTWGKPDVVAKCDSAPKRPPGSAFGGTQTITVARHRRGGGDQVPSPVDGNGRVGLMATKDHASNGRLLNRGARI